MSNPMSSLSAALQSSSPSESLSEPLVQVSKVPRKARKPRIKMQTPQPIAIRSHWEWATDAEKEQAQTVASSLMEYWIGHASKQEISLRLNLPPLRVWQLSSQAISGMLVGLLTQPKMRAKGNQQTQDPESDPKRLSAQIITLERKLTIQKSLIEWLRALPANRSILPPEVALEMEASTEVVAQEESQTPKNAKPARKAKLRA